MPWKVPCHSRSCVTVTRCTTGHGGPEGYDAVQQVRFGVLRDGESQTREELENALFSSIEIPMVIGGYFGVDFSKEDPEPRVCLARRKWLP